MPNLRFETPVWVRYRDGKYLVKSLLKGGETISHERYEKALQHYTNTVRRSFLNQVISEALLFELQWFMFDPELQFFTLDLGFEYGRRSFHGTISVYRFALKDFTVVGLPAFDNLQYISRHADPNRVELVDEVIEQLQAFARRETKERGQTFVITENYHSTKGEFPTKVEVNVQVRGNEIAVKEEQADFFKQFFQQQMHFDGWYELSRVGHSLNGLYPNNLMRAFEQAPLVEQVYKMLFKGGNVPVVLLGPRRVGKSTILQEALFQYINEDRPESHRNRVSQVWEVDPSRVIAGMSIVGMWQRRLEAIIKFVQFPDESHPQRKDKLYFNNIIALFRIGKSSQNNMTLSDVLKPYMQNREVQVILEASPEEWDVASELDRGFTDLFKVVRVHEPPEITSLKIIGKMRMRAEADTKLMLSNMALIRLIDLQKRFFRSEVLVGRIAEGMKQLATKYLDKMVTPEIVQNEFSAQTHLHPRFANADVALEENEFQEHFSARLIGQPEAVDCMVNSLHTIKAQLNNPDRPFGAFLFIGPTGVGKTLAAKELAKYLFTHEDGLVRFDMNEYIDPFAVKRLVGDFDNPEGQLTSKIRYNPYCVLLFDEIEKAHPDVHNLLLQVLGEGRLTDSLGRTVSFCNTVIIMTSNLGAERVGKEINLLGREDVASSTYRKAVMDFFRPEFINRIDQIVIFNRLKAEHIARIAWLQINDLLRRHGFVRRHTILQVSPEALEDLALKGFDPNLGGRALKRQIEKEMTALLAEQLVSIRPEYPVIFNLELVNNRLTPILITLENIAPNPEAVVPDYSNLDIRAEEMEYLLNKAAGIKDDLLDEEEEEDAGGFDVFEALEEDEGLEAHFELKDRLYEVEEQIRRYVWDISVRRKVYLNHKDFQMRWLPEEEGTDYEAFFSRGNIQDRLKTLYKDAPLLVSETNARFFSMTHDLNWLEYFQHHLVQEGVDEIMLENRADSVPKGIKFYECRYILDYLSSHYSQIYSSGELYAPSMNAHYLYFKGPGLAKLFEQEVGVHLAFIIAKPPIPITIKVHRLSGDEGPEAWLKAENEAKAKEEKKITEAQTQQVVRIYSFAELEEDTYGQRQTGYVFDLRTGMIHHTQLSGEDFRLFFFANFPETFKIHPDKFHEDL